MPAQPRPAGAAPAVVGGQALSRGIVMCGASAWALAVRDPATGAISTRSFPRAPRGGLTARVPVIRGLMALAEGIAIGAAARRIVSPRAHPPTAFAVVRRRLSHPLVLLAAAAALLLVSPALLILAVAPPEPLFALVEGALRAVLLVLALRVAGRLPAVRRAFAHHGAEHTAVAWHEAGRARSVETFSRFHARCGTTLVAAMLLVAVPVLAPLGAPGLPALLASRLLALPLVAGLAFELLRAGVPVGPGLWLQRLTTREPGPAELAVAVAALDALTATGTPDAVRLAA